MYFLTNEEVYFIQIKVFIDLQSRNNTDLQIGDRVGASKTKPIN
jgi:hypothetical protein